MCIKKIILLIIMSDKKYICNICDNKYKTPQSLCNHKKIYHTNIHKNIPETEPNKILKKDQRICNHCNKEYSREDNLKRHLQICKSKDNLIKQKEDLKNEIQEFTQSMEEFKNQMIDMMNIFNNMDLMDSYIYLIQEREFIKTKEPIYKIGKSRKEAMKRVNQYPKGSVCLLHVLCKDCDKAEKALINLFKNKHQHMPDIGNEYFKGNVNEMMDDIYINIKNNNYEYNDGENRVLYFIDNNITNY